jgi:hypothetical protein
VQQLERTRFQREAVLFSVGFRMQIVPLSTRNSPGTWTAEVGVTHDKIKKIRRRQSLTSILVLLQQPTCAVRCGSRWGLPRA